MANGIKNYGNTCYLNSLIQCLRRVGIAKHIEDKSSALYNILQSDERQYVMDIVNQCNFAAGTQQSSSELLLKILESSGESESIASIFKSTYKCWSQCSTCGKRVPLSDDISIPHVECLDPNRSLRAQVCGSITDIEGFKCPNCKSRTCKKISKIKYAGDVIVVLLNKYNGDQQLRIPRILKLRPRTYELVANVNHCGSLHGGHYTARIKNEESHIWEIANDSSVSNSSSGIDTRSVYLAFYVRQR